jgi:chemotaxis protein histidine kinase CheA
LTTLIEEAARGLDSLARDLKKQMPLICMPQGLVLVKEKGADFLYNIFLHLFRNSMDHGIEAADQRLQSGKNPRGTISISLDFETEHLILSYSDDGNGLDLNAIESRGRDLGLIQEGQSYTDLELASLIFVSGFSTRNAVSEISGRGVGLNAVKTYCQDLGISIDIRLQPGMKRGQVPFSFELTLPLSLFWLAKPYESGGKKAS